MAQMLSQFASTNGDGTGTTNAVGDYSSAATKFTVETQPDQRFLVLRRMVVTIEDVGAPDSGSYGNNITLANGVEVNVYSADDTLAYTLTPDPVLTNANWATYCHDLTDHSFGTGNDTVTVRWTFTKANPDGITLDVGEYLAIELNDDFTDLVGHYFLVQGTVG